MNYIFKCLFIVIGTLIGAGFASGQEILTFFNRYGVNGYYGMTDNSNNILIKNEHDKIKPLYDVFVTKKYDKFGIVNKNGKIILQTEYDKVKKLGEYIIVKKDGKYGVLDDCGNIIAETIYKKIRLNRNTLEVKLPKNSWKTLQ